MLDADDHSSISKPERRPCACYVSCWSGDRSRSICQYAIMRLWGFKEKIANFLSFSCPSILKRDLNKKKTPLNIEVCFQSLEAILESWFIERGLFLQNPRVFLQNPFQATASFIYCFHMGIVVHLCCGWGIRSWFYKLILRKWGLD